MAEAKKIWEERNKRTCVIVDFASSASVVGSIASTLKDVVYKVRMYVSSVALEGIWNCVHTENLYERPFLHKDHL